MCTGHLGLTLWEDMLQSECRGTQPDSIPKGVMVMSQFSMNEVTRNWVNREERAFLEVSNFATAVLGSGRPDLRPVRSACALPLRSRPGNTRRRGSPEMGQALGREVEGP